MNINIEKLINCSKTKSETIIIVTNTMLLFVAVTKPLIYRDNQCIIFSSSCSPSHWPVHSLLERQFWWKCKQCTSYNRPSLQCTPPTKSQDNNSHKHHPDPSLQPYNLYKSWCCAHFEEWCSNSKFQGSSCGLHGQKRYRGQVFTMWALNKKLNKLKMLNKEPLPYL